MKKLVTLLALYFAQGLPFGFQSTALPLLLRERGASLEAVGFAGLLSAPWMAKAFWAPWVDRFGSERVGRRKTWIIPAQFGLTACALFAAGASSQTSLLVTIFFMNLLAATQDIAVDGLAVSWLNEDELGPGNAIQVVGYKLGMLTGGGLLLWASARIGYKGLFDSMAALMALVLVMSIGMREAPRAPGPRTIITLADIFRSLRRALLERKSAALLAIMLTYKLGETLANTMWKPLLFDRGFSVANVGLWTGTFGMICSLIGSFGSGVLVRRASLTRTLVGVAMLRALGVLAFYLVSAANQPSVLAVISATCVEHFFGGAITTVVFAMMMRHTDREIGATHYTLLATLEVWGKVPFSSLSGVIASAFGYQALFASSTLLCLAFGGLAIALRPRLENTESSLMTAPL